MTLFETIELINKVGSEQPNINMVVESGDIFDLNTNNYTAKYSVFCCEQLDHTQNGDFLTYNFRLYVVDRLTDDRENKIEVQSNAIETLSNIVRGLEEMGIFMVGESVTYSTFTERFEAECAGAFCTIGVSSSQEYVCYDN